MIGVIYKYKQPLLSPNVKHTTFNTNTVLLLNWQPLESPGKIITISILLNLMNIKQRRKGRAFIDSW